MNILLRFRCWRFYRSYFRNIFIWDFSPLLVLNISIKLVLATVVIFLTSLISLNSKFVCKSYDCFSFTTGFCWVRVPGVSPPGARGPGARCITPGARSSSFCSKFSLLSPGARTPFVRVPGVAVQSNVHIFLGGIYTPFFHLPL